MTSCIRSRLPIVLRVWLRIAEDMEEHCNAVVSWLKYCRFKIDENMNVTPAEFRYLKETLSKDLIALLMERKGMSMEDAFRCYYDSATFQKISNPETGLYFQSPGYVYSYLEEEI